jgi:hypothetical protein
VRTPTLSSVFYEPGNIPEDAAEMRRFLLDELPRIAAAISALAAGHLDKSYAAPTKPRDGDLRYADGTTFKPNGTGGAGIWYYNGTAWVLLG